MFNSRNSRQRGGQPKGGNETQSLDTPVRPGVEPIKDGGQPRSTQAEMIEMEHGQFSSPSPLEAIVPSKMLIKTRDLPGLTSNVGVSSVGESSLAQMRPRLARLGKLLWTGL
jgi:hypothetical protein